MLMEHHQDAMLDTHSLCRNLCFALQGKRAEVFCLESYDCLARQCSSLGNTFYPPSWSIRRDLPAMLH